MSLIRPTSNLERGSGVDPSPAPAAAWKALVDTDLSSDSGSYGFTLAAGQNGFGNRITIDRAASSAWLDRSVCAFVYYDTGISLTELQNDKALVVSVLLEFDIPSTSPILGDDYGLNFGPVITNSTTLSTGATGAFGGISGDNQFGRKMVALNGIGKIGSNTSLGSITFPISGYDQNSDTINAIQLSSTGRIGTASNFGFSGNDLSFGITKSGTTTFIHAGTAYQQLSTNAGGVGNLVVGAMFGQKQIGGAGSGTDKTFDFTFKYLVERT